jgi:hypothetical protein
VSIGPLAPQGVGYLVPVLDAATFDALRALRGRRDPVLWLRISSGSLTEARGVTRFDVDAVRPGNGTPSGPEDVAVHVRAFLDAHGRAMVVVDCVDDPSSRLGSDRAVRLLQDFHETITARDAVLLVAQPRRAGSRIAAYLEREFEPFPYDALHRAFVREPIT